MKTVPLAFAAALLATTALAQTTTSPGSTTPAPNTATTPGAATGTPGIPLGTTAIPNTNGAPDTTMGTATPGAHPSTANTPGGGVVDRNTGPAAASGDRNQAVATTSAHASQPAHGANSFSMGEARRKLESNGFQNVSGLKKDNEGVWRGRGTKSGQQVSVWLDYKGNVGQQ